jgi:hypothetical protein
LGRHQIRIPRSPPRHSLQRQHQHRWACHLAARVLQREAGKREVRPRVGVGRVGRQGNVCGKPAISEAGERGKARTHELSPLDAASTNAERMLLVSSSKASPKATTSTATLFFLSRFASRTRAGPSAPGGEPTNTITRCRRFLFCRCFSASCATAIAVGSEESPPSRVSEEDFRSMRRTDMSVQRWYGMGHYTPFVCHGHDANRALWI